MAIADQLIATMMNNQLVVAQVGLLLSMAGATFPPPPYLCARLYTASSVRLSRRSCSCSTEDHEMAYFTPLLAFLVCVVAACSAATVPARAPAQGSAPSSDLKAESSYGLGYGLGGFYGGGYGFPGYPHAYGYPYRHGWGYPGYGFGYGGFLGGYPYY